MYSQFARSFVLIFGKSSSSLIRNQNPNFLSKREIQYFISLYRNRVNEKRLEEVGPDFACAEWLMRCGGIVKWKGSLKWQIDFNISPVGIFARNKIEEIDGSNSSIMPIGFEHLKGLEYVNKIILHRCYYIDNSALERLQYVVNSLYLLQITSCRSVTDNGIKSLHHLKNLRYLFLFDLPAVRNRIDCMFFLNKALPDCEITWN